MDLLSPQTISNEYIDKMEKELTEGELLNIIKSVPYNKTPGEDGLPAEFYKVFWLDIKSLLLNSYNYSFEQGSLSITQRRGVLCLIHKKTDPLKLNKSAKGAYMWSNIEFDVTIKNTMLGNLTILSFKYLWSCCILHSCQVLGGKWLVWFGLLRVVPYKMASLATVYLGRANSIMILFVLAAACESGSPLDMAA